MGLWKSKKGTLKGGTYLYPHLPKYPLPPGHHYGIVIVSMNRNEFPVKVNTNFSQQMVFTMIFYKTKYHYNRHQLKHFHRQKMRIHLTSKIVARFLRQFQALRCQGYHLVT